MATQRIDSVDPDLRQAVVQDICTREGHGVLAEITTMRLAGCLREYLCNRGCGATIYETGRPLTVAQLTEFLTAKGIDGEVVLAEGARFECRA